MQIKPQFINSPIIAGVVALTLLSGCQNVLKIGLTEEDQIKFDTMSTTIVEQSQNITELEDSVSSIIAENAHAAREIHHLRETMGIILEEVEVVKEAADRRAIVSRGDVAIHLASYRNMDTTLAGWKTYTEKYGDAFSNLVGIVSVFTSGSGDSFYRLKAGPFSSQETALAFCQTLEARDDYCNVDKFEGDIID